MRLSGRDCKGINNLERKGDPAKRRESRAKEWMICDREISPNAGKRLLQRIENG
jgi:hypothetical protein